MTAFDTIETVRFTQASTADEDTVFYGLGLPIIHTYPHMFSAASGMRVPSDWLRSEAGDGCDRLLWKRLVDKTEKEEGKREEYRRKYPKGASAPNRCRRWVGCRGWDARYGYKHLRMGKLYQLPPPANVTPEIRARRTAMVEPGPWEWDKMVGLGGVWWEGRWVEIGGDERQGGRTVWHVPDFVLEGPGAAMRAANEARSLRRVRTAAGRRPKRWRWVGPMPEGMSHETIRYLPWSERKGYYKRAGTAWREPKKLKKPKTVINPILPLRNVPGSRSCIEKKVILGADEAPDARQLIFHKEDRSAAASAAARAADPAEIERARLEWFRKVHAEWEARRKYDAEVAEIPADTGKCLKIIEGRLAEVRRPWTHAERAGAGEFLVDRIIRLRRAYGVSREEVGCGLTKVTLGRLERDLESDDVVAPQVGTIRKLVLAVDALRKTASRQRSPERRELTEEEKIKRHKAYPHPADPIERALGRRRSEAGFRAALSKLDLYREGCHTVGEGPNVHTKVRRSGALWDGLKRCRSIPSREKGEHVGDAYYALIKEFDKDPDAVPVEELEALAEWVTRTVKRTGGLTHGRYGDGVQVTSRMETEKSHRSRTYLPEDESARYIDEALNKAIKGADFELADDGDPVHEILAAQELRATLRGGEPDIEILMMATPATYRKPHGGVLPGCHYVNGERVNTLGDLYMYDDKDDRKAMEIGSVADRVALQRQILPAPRRLGGLLDRMETDGILHRREDSGEEVRAT